MSKIPQGITQKVWVKVSDPKPQIIPSKTKFQGRFENKVSPKIIKIQWMITVILPYFSIYFCIFPLSKLGGCSKDTVPRT